MQKKMITRIDENNFKKEVLQEEKLVVVDFSAEWCGSCKAVSKIISELAEDYAEKVKFCEIDISKNSNLAGKFNITSLPTIIFMKQGKEIARKNGYTPREFKEIIQKLI